MKKVVTFCAGAVSYMLLEMLTRGRTHWSMGVAGGVCLIMLVNISHSRVPFIPACALGALSITMVEFCIGCVVNLWLNLNVWDYSDRPGNIMGQVCPLFTGLWFGLCVLVLGGLRARCKHGKSALFRKT